MQTSFPYKNGNVSYRVEGSGQPIILLHGFGEDSTIWDEQVTALAGICQVIVPDLPGTGLSDLLLPANEAATISIEDYADSIYALAQYEHITSFTLLGHSMGGYIALAFAEKYGSMLEGFGLLHSTAFADTEEKKISRKKGIEMMQQYGGHAFLKSTTPNLFSAGYKQREPDKVASLIEKGKEFSTVALIQYYEAMMNRPDRTDVLKNSQVSVLFIIGSADVAAPMNDLLQQVHLPARAYIHILEDVGHIGLWEATEQFNQHLFAYIKDVKDLSNTGATN